MRPDAIGFFWEDLPPEPKVKKEAVKRKPPEPHWLREDYLPGIEELLKNPPKQDDQGAIIVDILQSSNTVFDFEVYQNYTLCCFKTLKSGLKFWFEIYKERNDFICNQFLDWVLKNACLIGFNSNNYDLIILAAALAGKTPSQIKQISNEIIELGMSAYELRKLYKLPKLSLNTIDIKEVLPGSGGLKIYAGRVHSERLQDLPFHQSSLINDNKRLITVNYCLNDLQSTQDLFKELLEPLKLRITMSSEYGIDLRSKSDAQIAEAVIAKEVYQLNRKKLEREYVSPGTVFSYKPPAFLQFKTPRLNAIFEEIKAADYIVKESGSILKPPQFDDFNLSINGLKYKIGLGGLHSQESQVNYTSSQNNILLAPDVTSYYPFLILNNKWFPKTLGTNFLLVYDRIVRTRLNAKSQGLHVISESLKIVINGSFGKLSSPYSLLYSPDLLIQVTLTGQLTLLMLIEEIELYGVSVVSANTDGIVVDCPKQHYTKVMELIKEWENKTKLMMEVGHFKALFARDVNSYIALKYNGKPKLKGDFSRGDISRNVVNEVCLTAAINYLDKQIPIEDTIYNERDIRQFLSIRQVAGGAVKVWPDGNEYLGKVIRSYYSTEVTGEIIYAKSGNKVPNSENSRPMMQLQKSVSDLDYTRYVNEAYSILESVGLKVA